MIGTWPAIRNLLRLHVIDVIRMQSGKKLQVVRLLCDTSEKAVRREFSLAGQRRELRWSHFSSLHLADHKELCLFASHVKTA